MLEGTSLVTGARPLPQDDLVISIHGTLLDLTMLGERFREGY
jgi:hypothetical protein